MSGPFKHMNRAEVLSAIASKSANAVDSRGGRDGQIKVMYELMLDAAMKRERQAQILQTASEPVAESGAVATRRGGEGGE